MTTRDSGAALHSVDVESGVDLCWICSGRIGPGERRASSILGSACARCLDEDEMGRPLMLGAAEGEVSP